MRRTSETQGSIFQRVAEEPTSSRAAAKSGSLSYQPEKASSKEHWIPGKIRKPCLSGALEDCIWTLHGLLVCLKINLTMENVCPICTISKVCYHYYLVLHTRWTKLYDYPVVPKAGLTPWQEKEQHYPTKWWFFCAVHVNVMKEMINRNTKVTQRCESSALHRLEKMGDESASIITKKQDKINKNSHHWIKMTLF